MAFDGIVTKSVIAELNTCVLNGKINKVYEPSKNDIILGIYSNGKNYALHICIDATNCRMHLTTTSKPNPLNAPNFCMLLRKHLIGMRIKSISNYDLERVITIELEGFNELNDLVTKKLIVELMGKHSNIILVNENNIILDSLRHLDTFSNSNRDILPAHEYIYPISDKISFLKISNFNEFYNIISKDLNTISIDNILSNSFIGISKVFIHSLLDKLTLANTILTKNDTQKIYNYIKEIVDNTSTSCLSCINYADKNKLDYVLVLKENNSPLNINFFINDFYSKKEIDEEFKSYRNSILKLILNELKKYTKRLSNINQKLEECSKMDTYKLYGELITANLYKIPNNNTDKILLENYYDNNNIIEIPLDKTISPSYNAKKYFKKYNKLKNALEIVSLQKSDTAKEINYIESIIYELESAKTVSDINDIYAEISENIVFKDRLSKNKSPKKSKMIKKKKPSENTDPLLYTIDGFDVFVGKNNKNNDYLTLKLAHNNDLWFHTKDIHGSHVILKTDGKEIEYETINKCASLAAFHSKASNSSNVPVDYTYIRYVKKPSGAKPGMVIYTNYNTVNVNPMDF